MFVPDFTIMKVSLKPLSFLKIAVFAILFYWIFQQLNVHWNTAKALGQSTTFNTTKIESSFISDYQKRYAGLDSILKPNGRYMYKSDSVNFPLYANNYIISQYTLAPAVLLENKLTDTLIFNLYASMNIQSAGAQYLAQGYTVFYQNSFGVFLLHK
jgi:hypothetical protein